MLHVPSICRPCPATALSPFDPPALPIQFEYQQAQLEAEIENLSWKVERADSYDRGVSACRLPSGKGRVSFNSDCTGLGFKGAALEGGQVSFRLLGASNTPPVALCAIRFWHWNL